METLFTVVIPNYNREKMIGKAIQSVRKQSYRNWKLLIIDDASNDRSLDVIKPHLKDRRIELIQLPSNLGISHVMNRALKEVSTPYFIQLDSDDWLAPHALKEFAKAIRKTDQQTALFYGNIKKVRKIKGQWKVFAYTKHRPFENKYDFLVYLTEMLHPRCYRTEAVQDVGGWDTSDPYQGRIMEDRRMCLKLIEKYPIHWINKYLYFRRKHQNQLTKRDSIRKRNFLRKMVIQHYLWKWGNIYKPIFSYNKAGFLIIKELKKI